MLPKGHQDSSKITLRGLQDAPGGTLSRQFRGLLGRVPASAGICEVSRIHCAFPDMKSARAWLGLALDFANTEQPLPPVRACGGYGKTERQRDGEDQSSIL